MADEELLQAVSHMFDEKLEAFEQKMDAKMDAKLQPVHEKLDSMDARIKKLELMTENIIIPRIKHVEECYLTTYERYKKYCARMEMAFMDIEVLKMTVQKHSMILQTTA